MIGQNPQAAFQQAKADHDFVEQERELKANTDLTGTAWWSGSTTCTASP